MKEIVSEELSVRKLLEMFENLEKEAFTKKQIYLSDKHFYILNTNWDQINTYRKENGLPKISNQTMKDAYIFEKTKQEYEDYKNSELQLEKIKRIYYLLLEGYYEEGNKDKSKPNHQDFSYMQQG